MNMQQNHFHHHLLEEKVENIIKMFEKGIANQKIERNYCSNLRFLSSVCVCKRGGKWHEAKLGYMDLNAYTSVHGLSHTIIAVDCRKAL